MFSTASSSNQNPQERALRQAAANNDLPKVQRLVEEEGVDINARGPETGKTALHQAAMRGHVNIVTYFLQRPDVKLLEDKDQKTAFDLATDKQIKRLLLNKFHVIQSTSSALSIEEMIYFGYYHFEPQQFMDQITQANNPSTVEKLLTERGLTADSYFHGMPVLLLATLKDKDCVRNGKLEYLIANSSNINQQIHDFNPGGYENTALHAFMVNETWDDADSFLELAKKYEKTIELIRQDVYGRTVLHLATIFRKADFLKKLLVQSDYTKAIDLVDENGRTALHYAYLLGNKDLITMLEECGAKTDILDKNHNTPAEMLEEVHDTELESVLSGVAIRLTQRQQQIKEIKEDRANLRQETYRPRR